jgi:hypothetical protein
LDRAELLREHVPRLFDRDDDISAAQTEPPLLLPPPLPNQRSKVLEQIGGGI